MRKGFRVRWLWLLLPALILLSCLACCFVFNNYQYPLQDTTPEDVFKEYVWKSEIIPAEVKNINAVEGIAGFSSTGPAFARFNASYGFIAKLVATKFTWYEEYTQIPCDIVLNSLRPKTLYRNYSKELDWWHPEEIISPKCYQAQGSQGDDFRYLLIGIDEETVYFYQNASCGICPD